MADATAQEIRYARGAYNWLRVSPLLTIPTLYFAASVFFQFDICSNFGLVCNYSVDEAISYGGGVVVSALWHLLLLQYANHKNSEFVREHGRIALTHAGIRTGVALVTAGMSIFLFGASSVLLIGIVILIILWANSVGMRNRYLKEYPEFPGLVSDDVSGLTSIQNAGTGESNDENDNTDIRMDAREAINRPRQSGKFASGLVNTAAGDMTDPKQILDDLLVRLRSGKDNEIFEALEALSRLGYSSEAVRHQLERLAIAGGKEEIRNRAIAALDSAANRAVQKRFNSNKLDRGIRYTLLQEINEWVKYNLVEKPVADVLRRRYDFDIAPQPAPVPAPTQTAASTPQVVQPNPAPAVTPAPTPSQPSSPPEPRPSLLQTLTSEASIKIYLYLGAFFVIAAAAILGAVVPELRLPILIIGTFIFGALAVLIKKRLPQPSFALFIVFSFLLPITANSLHESLRQSFDIPAAFTDGYWAVVFFIMAVIWSGSTRLYESRFFSIAAFGALTLSFFNVGLAFDAKSDIYTMLMGFAALAGLTGTWLLKTWKGGNFALPVFILAQILQIANLIVSLSAFGISTFDPSYENLFHLVTFTTWLLAMIFYLISEGLFPFFAFPWLSAATLVPMPWFIAVAFDVESLGSTILLFTWGAIFAVASEALFRLENVKKYSLPMLLSTLPSLGLAVFTGLVYEIWLCLVVAVGVAFLFTILHILRTRWWLWTLALLYAVVAYFAFLQLDFIKRFDIPFSYSLVGLTILLLLPDLWMKKDWKENPAWRLPPRLYGAAFLLTASLVLLFEGRLGHVAIGYLLLAVFCAVYALTYRKTYLAYIPAALLPLAILFALDAFKIDAWVPSLSALALLYYAVGIVIRKNEKWSTALRSSGMALGVTVSLAALIFAKESSGWYALLIGAVFVAEMHVRKNGLFELGAPLLFTSGAFLILRDYKIDQGYYHLLTYSLIWVFADLANHLTYDQPRPLKLFVRGIGGLIAALNFILLLMAPSSRDAALSFGIYTLSFAVCAFVYRRAWLGYIPAATLPLTIYFTLDHFNMDAWLLALTGLAVLYFVMGLVVRSKANPAIIFRNSALILGSIVSIGAFVTFKETGGWYMLATGLLYIAEMLIRKNGLLEPGAPVLFTMGIFQILNDLNIERITYHLLAYSLIWLLADVLAHLAFPHPRPLKWLVRIAGGLTALVNYGYLFSETDALIAAISFAVYSLVFLTVSLVYRQPNLLYTFTLTLPLFATFLFRAFEMTRWIHPVVVIAALYYGMAYFLRSRDRPGKWAPPLLYSGLSLGVFVSIAAVRIGGLDASIPVAVAATLWAVEAFAKRNAWLAFPANALYLLSYFIILFDLDVSEPQFFSVGAALFGLIQHYLLTRSGSKTGAFIMGMFSQFVLLGTTYIEMINRNDLGYFFLLFGQSLVVLVYGIVIRSRSLTFFPIGFVAVGVVTVVYSALKDRAAIFVIGCTGIVLLTLGVVAVLLRERIAKLGERLSDWRA